MIWTNFLTYGGSQEKAFETFINQLFERYLIRTYKNELTKSRVINGAGGDGGIEAYGQLISGDMIAVQSKWFRSVLDDSEFNQIRKSVTTAKDLRPQIKEYIICIPHDVSSLKYGRGKQGSGKKPIDNYEEKKIDEFTDEIISKYNDLKITWWFEKDIELELQQRNNEGVHKYWFEKEIISQEYLQKQFNLQKQGWLHERYIPELHGQGLIHQEYQKLCFSSDCRQKLFSLINSVFNSLLSCISKIDTFITTNQSHSEINIELKIIKENLKTFISVLQNLGSEAKSGNDFFKSVSVGEIIVWKTKMKLDKLIPSNIQKSLLPKLIKSLENIHSYDLHQFIQDVGSFQQTIRLILGEAGSGKTHGLANCVEKHLEQNLPAIIIQAKGTPCNNWTEILSKSLEINNWTKDEIFSALETVAKRNDTNKATTLTAGEENKYESTKGIICVDGIEEDPEYAGKWYERMRECVQFAKDFPHIRFIFSARNYFFDNKKIPKSKIYDTIFLPIEGDVSVWEVSKNYFKHFNIQISSHSLIKGIDNLFALRLFCEQYRNCSLTESDKIVTATRELLNLKIEKINEEFFKLVKKGQTRNPVRETLEIIADHFYTNVEIEHDELVRIILKSVESYMDGSEVDILIDHLTMNGFIVRSERIERKGALDKKTFVYYITYQSIIEHIISEKILQGIKNGSIIKIPDILHKGMIQPVGLSPRQSPNPLEKLPNQKIIQSIVNNLFIQTGQLIGENNFLIQGFSQNEIFEMQMEAIRGAPHNRVAKYKNYVDEMFFGGFRKQFQILKYLIIPSSHSAENYFGAEYLHQILINKPSVFERDRLWSGLDSYERGNIKTEELIYLLYENVGLSFGEFGTRRLFLSSFHLHTELPLVYAWGLSTIDQRLRNSLRVALTEWAIINPDEYILLLNKIFFCNDPQIQEDLASITSGVASKLKNKDKLKELALWSIQNIFLEIEIHRNVIVRQGFRAIVERAFQFGIISHSDVEICRPKPLQKISLLPLERNVILSAQGEYYPIVHDLAWYVVQKAYYDFLEYPTQRNKGELEDNDCVEGRMLLNEYRKLYDDNKLFSGRWGMAAAIAYIRGQLGLTRTEGNWHTEASGGSKSKFFTYEEKYTWLAVHYLQGYLSDYVPLKLRSDEREFITDYSEITDIPNPAESIIDIEAGIEKHQNRGVWVIKEILSKELENETSEAVRDWVNEEPNFDIENWLEFDSNDFELDEPQRKWIAIYSETTLHDSKKICYSDFEANACLIKKSALPIFRNLLQTDPDDLHFATHSGSLHSSPHTDIYCNPTDIVWMTWIKEDATKQTFYDSDEEKELLHTTTKITQGTINGEKHHILPSKIIRELVGCYELVDNKLITSEGQVLAFVHNVSEGSSGDSQEIVLIEKNALEKVLKEKGYDLVWFVELFRRKNPLNKKYEKINHVQKTRKYFVWSEGGQKKILKFWDEWFSNERDKKEGK